MWSLLQWIYSVIYYYYYSFIIFYYCLSSFPASLSSTSPRFCCHFLCVVTFSHPIFTFFLFVLIHPSPFFKSHSSYCPSYSLSLIIILLYYIIILYSLFWSLSLASSWSNSEFFSLPKSHLYLSASYWVLLRSSSIYFILHCSILLNPIHFLSEWIQSLFSCSLLSLLLCLFRESLFVFAFACPQRFNTLIGLM